MAIPNPNPNIEDGKACDNKTYSSNKINSLITAATELPVPGAGDAGKVLTVNAGADGFELDPIPKELPATELSDAGKVLTVNAAGTGYELDAVPTELPATELSDAGKVLTVNAAGTGYELDTPASSGLIVKKISWTGVEGWSKDIEIPAEDVNCTVLRIVASHPNQDVLGAESFDWGSTAIQYSNRQTREMVNSATYTSPNVLHIVGSGQSTAECFNFLGATYDMYYTTWN